MTNLKPCPFCGSPAKESFDEGRNQEWWIVCSNDDCDIFPTSACRVQEDARAWWNKRAAAPEVGLTLLEVCEELFGCWTESAGYDGGWKYRCSICEKDIDMQHWITAAHNDGCIIPRVHQYLAQYKPQCVGISPMNSGGKS